jgi:hypothetical protein
MAAVLRIAFLLTLLSLAALRQSSPSEVEFREARVHGRHAYILENGLIRVAALRGGGHLGDVRLLSPDPKTGINPMRVPHYPTIEPYEYDPARHDSLYGSGSHRWLSSGYMGHLLCFPFYGAPSSEDEVKAGLGNHGEAPIVEWKMLRVERSENALTLRYGADLPKTGFRVERAVTLGRGRRFVRVKEWVENLATYDRPINWMQHATFGPPFAEPGKMFLDASATRGQVGSGRPGASSLQGGSEVTWPQGTSHDGRRVDLRPFQPVDKAGTYYALLLDPSRKEQFFTLYHSDYRVLVGYLFPTEGNPWLADWQENRSNQTLPWNGQAVARGLEFGSTPFAEGLRKSVERGSLFGVPAYRWIGARRRLENEFTLFLAEIPDGFQGARDVVWKDGAPQVVPR